MHAAKVANASYEEQKAWDALLHSAFPKLSGGFVQSGEYSDALKRAGICSDWQEQMGYSKTSAVPARFFTYCVADGLSGEIIRGDGKGRGLARSGVLQDQVLDDLHKLGVKAAPFALNTFPTMNGEKTRCINKGFYLPRHQPHDAPSGPAAVGAPERAKSVPIFEGAVMFLAYLLHKGYVTEQDMPAGDVVYPQQDLSVPFGRTMFKMAQSVEYQNKVRAGLGEALLCEHARSGKEAGI